jgi:prophage regulatory protein
LLRKKEAADRLGVTTRTLERWERAGRFPARRRVGPNVVGWVEADVEEWIKSRERVPAKAAPLKARGSDGPGADG